MRSYHSLVHLISNARASHFERLGLLVWKVSCSYEYIVALICNFPYNLVFYGKRHYHSWYTAMQLYNDPKMRPWEQLALVAAPFLTISYI